MGADAGDERDFQVIAAEFLAERERRQGDTLRRYLERYPEYERELVLLASEMAVGEGDAPPATPPTAMLPRLRAQAHAILGPPAAPEIESLNDRAREHAGLSPRALAVALGIEVDVLAMLEERKIVA